MSKQKLNLAVIQGDTSTEHDVSIMSATSILKHLDQSKYNLIPITITQDNHWVDQEGRGLNPFNLPKIADVVFPVLHGPYGEDGTIQGLLELLRIPYIGCGVTSSAICMDKIIQKNICGSYDIPQVPYWWITKHRWKSDQSQTLKSIIWKFEKKYPLFIKPANQGSSVGVTKANNQTELIEGIELALTRDSRIIIEQAVDNPREIECSVLGNHDPKTSVLGEIIPHAEFYYYNTKYINDTSEAIIPAKLDSKTEKSILDSAKLAYEVLDCSGLARIDFLLDNQSCKYYLNELNTLPGFTDISMYPKLWKESGLAYPDLLDQLITLAQEKFQEKNSLSHTR